MLEIRNVSKTYRPKKGVPVKALDDVSLKFEDRGMVFILGKSGSGKSTLLNVLGGLDAADTGEFIIKGKSSKNFSQADFDSYRNTFIGFIFQEYNILPEFTVGANIALAMELQGKKATSEDLSRILDEVDLAGYGSRKPNELSGGQKQRVAIARALVKSPEIIMADEPTGALDSRTGKQVFDTLKKLSRTKLVLIVSHDRDFAEQYADRIIELKDGKILSDVSKTAIEPTNVNDGVSIIDGGLLHIKKGYTLTEADLAMINEYVRNAEGDTFISTDPKSNTDLKKVSGINEDGSKDAFRATDGEKVRMKEYTAADSKLIRSRLPYKNSLKIGASSLKSKPVRLVFTVILCLVAFTLFGVADAAGMYDRNEVLIQSMRDGNINVAAFEKNYQFVDVDGYEYTDTLRLNEADLRKIKTDTGMEMLPVFAGIRQWENGYSMESMLSEASALSSSVGINFYGATYSGYAELTDEIIETMGFSMTGRLPKADDEIAITKYLYEHFDLAGMVYYDPADHTTHSMKADEIGSVEDVIGKTVVFGGNSDFPRAEDANVKIVGVIDTGLEVAEKYQSYLPKSADAPMTGDTSIVDMLNQQEINNLLTYSYHSLIAVNKGMTAKLAQSAAKMYGGSVSVGKYLESASLSFVTGKVGSGTSHIATLEQMKAYAQIDWLNGEKTALAEGEVVLPYEVDYERYGNTSVTQDAIQALREAGFEGDGLEQLNKLFVYEFRPDSSIYRFVLSKVRLADIPDGFRAEHLKADGMDDEQFNTMLLDSYKEYLMAEGRYENAYGGKTGQSYHMEFISILYREMGVTSLIPQTGVLESYNYFGSAPEDVNYVVVGYYLPTADYTDASMPCIVSDTVYNGFSTPEQGDYKFALGTTPIGTVATVEQLVDYNDLRADQVQYRLVNQATAVLDEVDGFLVPMSEIFLYIGIFFAVFAALMMFNFISVSISYKKREIGILRAVGARSSDVFGIFFNESLIITLINFVLSSAATVVVITLLNHVLRTEFGLVLTVLGVGVRQFALLLGVGVLVAFVGSFLPVMRIAKKKPIDAIQNR